MIDAANPADNVNENDILKELITTLKGMEQKMYNLIAGIEDDNMMNLALLINDDLNKTIGRHKKLEKGKKPEGFISSNPFIAMKRQSLSPPKAQYSASKS